MVRLWEPSLDEPEADDFISIPLWFDYGNLDTYIDGAFYEFQFHYGSIMGPGNRCPDIQV